MPQPAAFSTSILYEHDLALWYADMVTKLRNREFSELDIDHLIEEIDGLAGRDRKEVESRLDVLLAHLLKRLYVASPQDFRGWENTIREQRKQLRRLFKQSPSLKNYASEVFPEVWQDALEDVRANYPGISFPEQWLFDRNVNAILGDRFWSD
jgi:hypothetical protein